MDLAWWRVVEDAIPAYPWIPRLVHDYLCPIIHGHYVLEKSISMPESTLDDSKRGSVGTVSCYMTSFVSDIVVAKDTVGIAVNSRR